MARSPMAGPAPWDLVAAPYTSQLAPHLARYAADALAWAEVRAGERVLDVAAGPGTLTVLAAALLAEVTAVDVSPRMIAELSARAPAGVVARVGDGAALPVDDGRFDAAFSMFGLMFFDDRARGFAELYRALAPGGRAVVSSWVPVSRVPAFDAAFAALSAALPELGAPAGPPPLSSAEAAVGEMTAAGFVDVTAREHTHTSTFPSVAALTAMLETASAPFVWTRARIGEARWASVRDAIAARLARALGEGPVDVPQPAILTLGRKP